MVVIGAGFAGLAAAVHLAGRGARVTVLERRGVLGGRAYSFVEPVSGAAVDNGQHLFMRCYAETLAFLRTLGTAGRLAFEPRLEVEMVGEELRSRLACPRLPAPLHLLAGFAGLTRLPWRDRLALVRGGLAVAAAARSGAAAEARVEPFTVAAWLDRLGQPASARRLFWDPLVLAVLNERPEVASARWLLPVVRRAFLGGARAADLGFARGGLSDLYAHPARDYLERRQGVVRTRAAVTALEVASDRVVAVRIAREGRHAEERLPVEAVVAAVPHGALSALLPADLAARPPFAALGRLGASPIVSLHLWYDRSIVARPFVGLVGSPLHWVFDRGTHVTAVASGARALVARSGADLLALAVAEIGRLLPGARGARLLRGYVIKERWATPSLAPGAAALRPGARTPLANLVLAGDWTDTGLPGTIEGAVQSGHAAAAALAGGAATPAARQAGA